MRNLRAHSPSSLIQYKVANGHYDFCVPDYVFNFFDTFLKDSDPSKILTYGVGGMELCEYSLQHFPNAEVHYYPESPTIIDVLQDTFSRDYRLADRSLFEDDRQDQVFDLILGRAMWMQHSWREHYRLDHNHEKVTIEPRLLDIISSALRLSENGIGIYAVPSAFFTNTAKFNTIEFFKQFGLWVTAAFHVAPALEQKYSPYRYQIIVQKRPSQSLFIAELGRETENYPYLISNYRLGKKGKIPALGAWINPDDFVSFPYHAETERVREYAKRIKATPTHLSQLGALLPRSQMSKYGNTDFILIPRYPNSPVELRTDVPEDRQGRGILFDYNPAKVSGDYLVNYLNSEQGRRLRASLAIGSTMPYLNPRILLTGTVVIPELSVQRQIDGVTNKINQLSVFLDSLHQSVWDDPGKTNEIEKTVESILEYDSLERWIETLPFPLASILYNYSITTKPKERYEWLINFYEALAAFQVILLLSGLCSQGECVADILEKEGIDKRGALRVASFGTWMALSKALRKTLKRKLESTEDLEKVEYYLSLYGNPPQEFMRMLLDNRYESVFFPAKNIRNDWKGHGGIVPDSKYFQLVQELEGKLPLTREIINDNFRRSTLVLPVHHTFSKGVFKHTVKVLSGRSPPFKEMEIETVSPMDDQYIYLVHHGQNTPVRILPFLQMRQTPSEEREACYFYNRIESEGKESGKIRLVTYHYAEQPEEYIESDEIKKYIEILKA